jgi:hypothetical protein
MDLADVGPFLGLFFGAWSIGFVASYKILIFKKTMEISS